MSRKNLLDDRHGLRIPARELVQRRKIRHGCQHVGMLLAVCASQSFQGLVIERLRWLVLAFERVHIRHAPEALQRQDVLVPKRGRSQREGAFDVLPSLRVQAQIQICSTDGLADGSLDKRLLKELAAYPRRRAVERGPHLQIGIGCGVRPGLLSDAGLRQQILLKKLGDRFRDGGLRVGALLRCDGLVPFLLRLAPGPRAPDCVPA